MRERAQVADVQRGRIEAPEGQADLRLGRWQNVFGERDEFDATIFDAPYGKRVHDGHNDGKRRFDSAIARDIDYSCIGTSDVRDVVEFFSPRTRGWLCSITSHDLIPAWELELESAGRYVFPPIPIIDEGSRVRLQGDGPSCWTVFMVVARPKTREMAKWGTLPGVYTRSPGDERSGRMGGKPLGVMRAIVRDYSRPGDVVCDPFAGYATTLLAALMEGRRAIGAECDPEAHAAALARLGRGYTLDLFGGAL